MSITIKEIQSLQIGGFAGIDDLEKLAKALGYDNNHFECPIREMLEDNPGMIDAIYQFVIDFKSCYGDRIEENEEDLNLACDGKTSA